MLKAYKCKDWLRDGHSRRSQHVILEWDQLPECFTCLRLKAHFRCLSATATLTGLSGNLVIKDRTNLSQTLGIVTQSKADRQQRCKLHSYFKGKKHCSPVPIDQVYAYSSPARHRQARLQGYQVGQWRLPTTYQEGQFKPKPVQNLKRLRFAILQAPMCSYAPIVSIVPLNTQQEHSKQKT